MNRLSGWARLWIVILLPVWAFATLSMVSQVNDWWRHSACTWNGCDEYQPARGQWDVNGEPIRIREPWLQEVRAEQQRRALLRAEHHERLVRAFAFPAAGVLIAFALAMIAKSAAIWVWRGFRPNPPPKP
jgi:hypothetical protein